MSHYKEMKTLRQKYRGGFVQDVSLRTGLSENTVQRQFAALLFLEAQGIDPEKLPDGISLLSLESVAKIMRKNGTAGRQLLEETLERRWTSRQLADLYKREYADGARPGGNTKHSGALASLYREIGPDAAAGVVEEDGAPQPDSSLPAMSVSRIPDVYPAVSDTEIVVPMVLAVKRLVEASRAHLSGKITATFSPKVLGIQPRVGPVEPLLNVTDNGGNRACIFVHDGNVHRQDGAEYAFTSAIVLAAVAKAVVHAYVADPRPELIASLRQFIEQDAYLFDVRRERLMIRPLTAKLPSPLDNIDELIQQFQR